MDSKNTEVFVWSKIYFGRKKIELTNMIGTNDGGQM